MVFSTAPVSARLSPDALHLEVCLAPDSRAIPPDALAALVCEECARLGIRMPLARDELDERLAGCRRGVWTALFSGLPPVPPQDGHAELLLPIPVYSERRPLQALPCPVRANMPLARLIPGTPGRPGRDLLARPVAARPPRQGHLPQGVQTYVSDDGTELRAACDGVAMMHGLQIAVLPLRVIDGDIERGSLAEPGGLYVRGSVREGTAIVADGDVYVDGDIYEATITARAGGRIVVAGSAVGTAWRQCMLYADTDITCHSTLHATLQAGRHLCVQAEARHSRLQAEGNLYLHNSLERGLVHAVLSVRGGLFPTVQDADTPIVVPSDRQHFRVATQLPAMLARQSDTSPTFRPCTLTDLSTGGSRCRLDMSEGAYQLGPGELVHLKFALPPAPDELRVVAQVSRAIAPGVFGLAFLQMTQHDHDLLTRYCLHLLLERRHSRLPMRADRTR